jgi:hypothetical protein
MKARRRLAHAERLVRDDAIEVRLDLRRSDKEKTDPSPDKNQGE